MSSKSDIVNNPREYSSEEIAKAIKEGIVTLYELSKGGNMTPLMKKRIEEKLVELDKPAPASIVDNLKTEEAIDNSGSNKDFEEIASEEIKITEEEPLMDIPEIILPKVNEELQQVETPSITDDTNSASDYLDDEIDNLGMFKRPFSFKGRIRRTEYGISFLLYFFGSYLINAIIMSPGMTYGSALFVFFIYYIPGLWFFWAQGCKRCHDRGNSGWYQIIPFYPLVLIFGDGELGSNQYGNNPKGL